MGKYDDWAREAREASALAKTSAGTFETNTGRPPGVRDVRDPGSSAGLLTGLRAGLSQDAETRARIYAASRFPDDPSAQERYGIIGGDVVFTGDDRDIYREGTGFAGAGEAVGQHGLPMAGGTVGGLLANAPGAGLGGAIGESVRIALSGLLNDEPQTITGNLMDIGAEGALNYGGWRLGDAIGSKLVDRRTARDLSAFNPAAAQALQRTAQEYGIGLTGAESSGLRSLQGKQRVLQNTAGEAGDVMGDFYTRRTDVQIPAAMERVLGPRQDSTTVGGRARDAATRALEQMKADRAKASSPFYKAAEKESGVETQSVVDLIDSQLDVYKGTRVGRELSSVKSSLIEKKGGGTSQDILKTRIDQLHAAKMDLDLKIKKMKRDLGIGDNDPALRPLMEVKSTLLDEMSRVSSAYDAGRIAHKVMSKPLNEAREGLIGELAKTKNDRLVGLAERMLNADSNTTTILQAKAFFERQAPGLWDDVLAVYLRQVWEKARAPLQSGSNPMAGANFAKTLNTDSMQRNLRAAMGPDRYQIFRDFLDVLEATGKVRQGDSITHFAGEASKQMAFEAHPVQNVVLKPVTGLRDWWLDVQTDAYKGELARIMTSPDALLRLRELRKLSPTSQKAMDIVSQVIVNVTGENAADLVESKPRTRLPAR